MLLVVFLISQLSLRKRNKRKLTACTKGNEKLLSLCYFIFGTYYFFHEKNCFEMIILTSHFFPLGNTLYSLAVNKKRAILISIHPLESLVSHLSIRDILNLY